MKILLFLFLLSPICFGFNAIIDTTATPLTTSYSTSPPSLQTTLTNLYLRATPTLAIVNPTTCRICVNTISTSSVAPTPDNGNEHCIAAQGIGFWDSINVPRGPANVYIRADQATCTGAGIIDIDIY